MAYTKKYRGKKIRKDTKKRRKNHFSLSRKHKKRHLGKSKRRHQRGGSCGCSAPTSIGSALQLGGNGEPLVGPSWSSNVTNWPGVAGVAGETNHYNLNKYHVDPQTSMVASNDSLSLNGGKKHRKRKIKQKAGANISNAITALVPAPITDVGRNMGYSLNSAYNTLNGTQAPVNPAPFVQPRL